MKQVSNYDTLVSKGINHKIIEVRSNERLLLALKVEEKYTNQVLTVLEKYSHLIEGPVMVNLFETQTLQDHLRDEWLYHGHEEYTVSKITNMLLEQLEKKDQRITKQLGSLGRASDLEILSSLRYTLECKVSDEVSVTLEGVGGYEKSGDIFTFDYAPIIGRARALYDIQEEEAMDLDEYIAMVGEEFLLSHLKGIDAAGLRKLAYASDNAEEFKEAVMSLPLQDNVVDNGRGRLAGCSGTRKDGFMSMFTIGFDAPKIEISFLGVCSAYLGFNRKDKGWSNKVMTLEGEELWGTLWYDLYAAHEVYLKGISDNIAGELKSTIAQKQTQMRLRGESMLHEDNNLSEWFDRTVPSIMKELNISESTVRKAYNSGIKKIINALAERGLSKDDVKEMLQCA